MCNSYIECTKEWRIYTIPLKYNVLLKAYGQHIKGLWDVAPIRSPSDTLLACRVSTPWSACLTRSRSYGSSSPRTLVLLLSLGSNDTSVVEEYNVKENKKATTSCPLLHHARRLLQDGGNTLSLSLSLSFSRSVKLFLQL